MVSLHSYVWGLWDEGEDEEMRLRRAGMSLSYQVIHLKQLTHHDEHIL